MRRTAKKKLKGERLRCGIGLSASPACIPPCFVLLIATSTAIPKGDSNELCACGWPYTPFCFCVARYRQKSEGPANAKGGREKSVINYQKGFNRD